jgi:hypothetical protein
MQETLEADRGAPVAVPDRRAREPWPRIGAVVPGGGA